MTARYWRCQGHEAHPAAIDIEDEPWPRSFVSEEPREGWVPVMFVGGP